MNVDRRNEILEIIFKKLEAANRWGCEEVGTIYDFEKFELKILQYFHIEYFNASHICLGTFLKDTHYQ